MKKVINDWAEMYRTIFISYCVYFKIKPRTIDILLKDETELHNFLFEYGYYHNSSQHKYIPIIKR